MSASMAGRSQTPTSAIRGLTAATITAVTREGSDLVVHLKDGVRSFYRSMYGTLVFVDAGTVQSTNLRNAATEERLEPGWKIARLVVADDVATLEVRQSYEMGNSTVVEHRIPCTAVRDHLRVSIGQALLQLLRS